MAENTNGEACDEFREAVRHLAKLRQEEVCKLLVLCLADRDGGTTVGEAQATGVLWDRIRAPIAVLACVLDGKVRVGYGDDGEPAVFPASPSLQGHEA